MYSNIRLIDCINKPKDLIDRAIELGLEGICVTEHECLSSHVEINQYEKEIREKYPNFKIGYGNEIYLTYDRTPKQKYYHFILIAKDREGYEALRKLSTEAWYHMYNYKNMDRVPTLYKDLKEVVNQYKGHLIATTACRGSLLGAETWNMIRGDETSHDKIVEYMLFMKDLFGDDFYIECAPSEDYEQIAINKRYVNIAKAFDVKMVFATDSHYLKKEDRYIHEAYLNSKDGDREVAAFYSSSYMMSEEEAREKLRLSFDDDFIDEMIKNTLEIKDKIGMIDLFHKAIIPRVEVDKSCLNYHINGIDEYPTLNKINNSNEEQSKFWLIKCIDKLKEKDLFNDKYLTRLETEADVIDYIGNKLDQVLFSYFVTMASYIDLFWECGSMVGPGRGSAPAFLSNWLLGITQLDPVQWNLPYWRFLNKERAELPDIDIDLSPLIRPLILKRLKQQRGEKNVLLVATFGTEKTRSSILTACRGYRSDEYPNGIDNDIGQYLSSMIPAERGFLWDIEDVVNGNPEKGRQPIHKFIEEVNKYPGLLDIIRNISGLVNKRSSHASGVIFYDNLTDTSSLMRTPSGDMITCCSLHEEEYMGNTKFDLLMTDAVAKLTVAFNLIQKYGYIEKDLSLREAYNKHLHPDVIDINDSRIWDALGDGSVLQVFQFSTGVGYDTAVSVKPRDPMTMTRCNALMRLMADKDSERPLDRFIRMKNDINQWYLEVKAKNLTEKQIKTLEKYYLDGYGCIATQEEMMVVLMDKDIADFSLSLANTARKIVSKKQMEKIPWLKDQLYSKMADKNFADYVWDTAIKPSLG